MWTGYRDLAGYGRIGSENEDGKAVILYAHRAMWESLHGPIPKGKEILQSCDRPACIAPWHMRLVTHAENVADRDAKGRTFRGSRKNPERLTPAAHLAYQREYQRRRRAAKRAEQMQIQNAPRG